MKRTTIALLAIVALISGACGYQSVDADPVGSIGISKVTHNGLPLSGSGTTANPLDMHLQVVSPIGGDGSGASPLTYGLNATGGYFGAGTDGALNFDGVSTVLGMVPVNCCFAGPPQGKLYSLTRDIHATTIDVQEGVLVYGPFRVLAKTRIDLHYNAATGYGGWIGHSGNDAANNVAGGATSQGSICGAAAGGNGQTGVGSAGGNAGNPRPRGATGTGGGTGAGGAGVSAGGASGSQGTAFLPQNGDIHESAYYAINMRTARDVVVSNSGGGGSGGGGGGGGGAGRPGGGGGSGGGCLVVAAPTITGTRSYADSQANCTPANTCLGVLSVHGGRAGNGTSSVGTATGGGGGGGGGLLVVVVADGVKPGIEIQGGPGGTGYNGGANGNDGPMGMMSFWNVGAN